MLGRENYLKAETRCDTYVSSERKACWQIMLDMLEYVAGVCEKNHLTYYAIGGTLLGAIRHKGMIPWDDDIDIALPRRDYERLKTLLSCGLPEHLFLQTAVTNPEYHIAHMKLRNSLTSGVDPKQAMQMRCFNMGIVLDIFPIDGIPKSRLRQKWYWFLARLFKRARSNAFRRSYGRISDYLKHLAGRVLFECIGSDRLARLQDGLLSGYDMNSCSDCAMSAGDFGFSSIFTWPSEWLRSTVKVPFEYLEIRVPERYEEVLSKTYGNWHVFVKGKAKHGVLILDAHRDYLSVLRDVYRYNEKLLEECVKTHSA